MRQKKKKQQQKTNKQKNKTKKKQTKKKQKKKKKTKKKKKKKKQREVIKIGCDFLRIISPIDLEYRQTMVFDRVHSLPIGPPRTKGRALCLRVLSCSQIGLPRESVYIRDPQDKG